MAYIIYEVGCTNTMCLTYSFSNLSSMLYDLGIGTLGSIGNRSSSDPCT
ncbi:hypothetical protein SORBI_3010G101700 [Sorghum bicolor]|uniref:Uncharacterized protein n=1 Tax=Sorghum bicolor TaxID=4558 RepID=A0A194YIC6_SORBI|nr:hypothetical protein SORBI_3010G101700 [Sorghum bicolor]